MFNIEQSTAIVFGLTCAVIALVLLVAFLADQVIRQNALLAEDDEVNDREAHAACMAHVADLVSNRFAAVVIRDLVTRYDTPAERAVIERIKRDEWTPEGVPLPMLWLLHHANERDPQPEERTTEDA